MDIIESEKFIKNNFMGKIFNIFSNYGSFIQIDFSEKENVIRCRRAFC